MSATRMQRLGGAVHGWHGIPRVGVQQLSVRVLQKQHKQQQKPGDLQVCSGAVPDNAWTPYPQQPSSPYTPSSPGAGGNYYPAPPTPGAQQPDASAPPSYGAQQPSYGASTAYGGGYGGSAAYSPSSFGDPSAPGGLSEPARAALARATGAMRRYGWLAFWVQLTLSVVSAVILLFSVAFTSQSGPKASLYLTLVGILAGFLSTFWAYGYQRISVRMQEYLDGADVARIKKQAVIENITRGILINVAGMGATLLGISTLVGLLVAKTLTNASVNPFVPGTAGGYNPVLALDVFLVQASTNTLLGHFLSLLCSLWLLNVIGEGRALRFQRGQKPKEEDDGVMGTSMSGGVYRMGGGGGSASSGGSPRY